MTRATQAAGQDETPETLLARQKDELRRIEVTTMAAAGLAAQEYLPALSSVRHILPLDDTQFISRTLAMAVRQANLPRQIKRNVEEHIVSLQATFKGLLAEAAVKLEECNYAPVTEVADNLPAANLRARAKRLVEHDKQLHISAQSLRLAVEMFSQLNEQIIHRIESMSMSPAEERDHLLGNAILVYEISEFVGGHLEAFTVNGVSELLGLHREETQRIEADRQRITQFRQELAGMELSEADKTESIASCDENLQALHQVQTIWQEFISERTDAANSLMTEVRRLAPIIAVRKKLAHDRIAVLAKIALASLLKKNSEELRTAATMAVNFQLAPLTSDRLNRLFGLEIEGSP